MVSDRGRLQMVPNRGYNKIAHGGAVKDFDMNKKLILIFPLILICTTALADPFNDLTQKEIVERITRLETKFDIRFQELDKALVLARNQLEQQKKEAKDTIDFRLKGMDEGTFATTAELKSNISDVRKDINTSVSELRNNINSNYSDLRGKIAANDRLIYIGMGFLICLQAVLFVGQIIVRYVSSRNDRNRGE